MANNKEAQARIKINTLLEDAGWRFFDDENGPANIQLEANVKIKKEDVDNQGDDFENVTNGSIDYLLLDQDGKALVVLEAKRENINPLSAKGQARYYARDNHARYIILSNGNIHYLWDIQKGNPEIIIKFPTQDSLIEFSEYNPNPESLSSEDVGEDYVALSQDSNFHNNPVWVNGSEEEKTDLLSASGIKILRDYQIESVHAIQKAAKEGKTRYLLEMATGTGKTLTTAAISKLFLKTGNAKRILFLVDRLELEDQAKKAFKEYLEKDYQIAVYKENKETWRNAQIVITTVQSLAVNDRYKKEFSPTDFEFVISDESHRSISGNARAVFEYFIGYKLGLTATPKDYLKGIDSEKTKNSQRAFERRQLLDTYKTFGCESGDPTYKFSLSDGVPEYLVNPYLLDIRTEITTELLSEEGYSVHTVDESGEHQEETFFGRSFERRFFNEKTNIQFCKVFLDRAKRDPVSGEIGKGIIFTVSQNHAAKITNILNKMAMQKWPEKYESDFAVQVTSHVKDAQQMTVDFSNDRLNGISKFKEGYRTSRTRIAVTVGMMTTGYDCPNLLNVVLMRPIFSPSDFVQIKGRGTRKNVFKYINPETKEVEKIDKDNFFLFDFFANYEYFEEDFDYGEQLELPKEQPGEGSEGETRSGIDEIDLESDDEIVSEDVVKIGIEGMRIDREAFSKFIKEDIQENQEIKDLYEENRKSEAGEILRTEVFDKPNNFMNLDKIKKALGLDRRVRIPEVLDYAFGKKEKFETKAELLDSEFEKFRSTEMELEIDSEDYAKTKYFFNTYIEDQEIETIIDSGEYALLETNSKLSMSEIPEKYGERIPMYIKDYINTNIYR
ncbi:MAG: DEAD/DEAH box helicase family protein [Candidatus Moraniibacteriota bacterium]|jgi:type I restriction enzyme, R subunit